MEKDSESNGAARSRTLSVLRVAIALALIAILVRRIGIESLLEQANRLDPALLLVPFSLIGLDTLVRSVGWRVLLRTRFENLSLGTVLYHYSLGMFVGSFLPSTVGSDVSRVVLMARRHNLDMEACAASVVVLNLAGLTAVCTLGAVSSLTLLDHPRLAPMAAAILLISLGWLGLVAVALTRRVPGWLAQWPRGRHGILGRIVDRLLGFAEIIGSFAASRRALAAALALCMVNIVLRTSAVFTVAVALEVAIPYWPLLVFAPAFIVISLLPISIGGFGGDQAVYVALFDLLGVPGAQAFIISAMISGLYLSFALLGGVLYLARGLLDPAAVRGGR